VGRVARLTGVSVRTLRHYDDLGLVRPARRSAAGYRLYAEADLERLQQVLFYRELGLKLGDIRRIMEDPAFDRRAALQAQRELLRRKGRRITDLIAAVDAVLLADERGTRMDEAEMFEAFGDFDPGEYREEVRERFDARLVNESERRTGSYSKDDWLAIRREQEAIRDGLAALMGRDPADPEVQALVARQWRLIDERFYPVTPEIFAGLGQMYVQDPRFAGNHEKVRGGLAAFMRDAMLVYSEAARR
jgi:DNA-binding transcriptional MerR regulator